VSPEAHANSGAHASPAPSEVDDSPHPGCNCGRRRAAPPPTPLLTPDLVIAARDRAREPELPAATEARALATPVNSRLARYDVIILGDEHDRSIRLAAEFARHEHRVFHFREHQEDRPQPTAPTLTRLSLPTGPGADETLLDELTNLRRTQGIEAAVLMAFSDLGPGVAQQARDGWGWRIAVPNHAPAALAAIASVQVTFESDNDGPREDGRVHLPTSTSWPARWAALDRAFRAAWPRASLVIVTYDNLAFSRMCIASILENTEYPNYEILIVDNASTDGSVEEFQRLARDVPHVRAIFNDHNAGLAPAWNLGFREASGDILVVLNNDIVVPPGWLTRLARHLEDEITGLVGPATNRTCNEAQLDIPYQTYGEYLAVAGAQGKRHEGERIPIRMPMFFCTALRRATYERLGPFDERYEVGMFEDEDYALRAKAAGYQVVWTPEVYIHHAYHASIGKLLPTGEYMRLVRLNQGRFEDKWGICWERHRPAPAQAS
jgi:GT2 family glycosyltransferase